ncbi:flagellar hook-basal body complex protein FliE [Peribacillus kribbensis]|uniref:flagellar hook-basal body complex protein FliE n=1 Tax=Peribacillus kribbensis TaxID=356658 RepID=UPI00042736CD|nr:flagellar hook-basal body complex protein FliE [Peribacillus kribbensis]
MINGIHLPVSPVQPASQLNNADSINTSYDAKDSFASVLKDSINKVNEEQNMSDNMTAKLVKGEDVDLHQVMIASQKASITLQAAMEVRNKVIEAYQETMRMQV